MERSKRKLWTKERRRKRKRRGKRKKKKEKKEEKRRKNWFIKIKMRKGKVAVIESLVMEVKEFKMDNFPSEKSLKKKDLLTLKEELVKVGRPAETYIQRFCVDTGYHLTKCDC